MQHRGFGFLSGEVPVEDVVHHVGDKKLGIVLVSGAEQVRGFNDEMDHDPSTEGSKVS
jgi:hypothetical protein